MFSMDLKALFLPMDKPELVSKKFIKLLLDLKIHDYVLIIKTNMISSGKTHTMEGNLVDPIKFGIIPRSTDAIFRALKETNYDSYKVTVSYLEIYNEDLRDLLVETNSTKLEIMNNKSGTFCR